MFPTARYDSGADRFAPHTDYLDFEGFDWTGAVLKMQVRDRKNGGTTRVDLAQVVSASVQGIRLESVTVSEGVPTSRVAWRIDEATLEAIDAAALGLEPDADVVLFLDLHITPDAALYPASRKFVAAAGSFTVRAGVTE